MPEVSPLKNTFWIWGIAVLALGTVIWLLHRFMGLPLEFKTSVVFLGAAVILYAANKRFFSTQEGVNDNIRFVIAFDAVVFIVIGLVAAILACVNWQVALLLAGSSLLIGGFFGLLFGYPQGVAQQSAQGGVPQNGQVGDQQQGGGQQNPPAQGAAQQNVPASNHAKNLVAESAATLGKVIAGFTLAKVGPVIKHFNDLCNTLGPALDVHGSGPGPVLAGVLMVYFLSTGFLSGLFLPSYFMKDSGL